MVKFSLGLGKLPHSAYGITGLVLGILGVVAASTQLVFNWFGSTNADKSLYSLFTILFIVLGLGFTYVANFRTKIKGNPMITGLKIAFILFVAVILLIMAVNGISMTLDTTYATYANNNLGLFTGIRMLTSITTEDVNSLSNFALGIRQIVRSLFMIVPALIATWGGLSVLTADSIDEAEGGILAIVAAFIVFIVVWVFKAIDVSLMTLFV